MHREILSIIGPLPPFYRIGEQLWGLEAKFDSDGDSKTPDDTSWRELTLQLRNEDGFTPSQGLDRLDVDPLEQDRNLIAVCSASPELVMTAASYLIEAGSAQKTSSRRDACLRK